MTETPYVTQLVLVFLITCCLFAYIVYLKNEIKLYRLEKNELVTENRELRKNCNNLIAFNKKMKESLDKINRLTLKA